ncbi:MAG: cation diffusion facilitator family transporter, partial [Candidatus Omnitrophota bacterium]
MRILTRRLLAFFVKDYENFQNSEVRAKYAYLEAGVSIFVNTIISLIKLVLGIISNSISLIADAFHTFSDVLTSVIVWAGFKASQRPADDKHPFGHGRIEIVSALIIGVLLVVTGFNFLKDSFLRILNPQEVKAGIGTIIFLIISAFLKEELAIFSNELGK